MAEFTFDQLMRTGHVKRWQIVRVGREQTIAEHMYRVWIVTLEILKRLEVDSDTAAVASAWALMHDIPEVLTGDIATPAKEAMRKALPADDPVRNIELSMSDTYREAYMQAKRPQRYGAILAYDIVKLADLIEAKCFLGCEMMGSHAREVYDGMCGAVERKFSEMHHTNPGYDWSALHDLINESWRKV